MTYPPASDSLYSLIYLTIERSPRFCFMSKTPFPFSPLGKIFHPPIGRPYVKAYPLNTFALSNGFCFRIALRLCVSSRAVMGPHALSYYWCFTRGFQQSQVAIKPQRKHKFIGESFTRGNHFPIIFKLTKFIGRKPHPSVPQWLR